MQFFFAENCDWIDPEYDFIVDESQPDREPQADDLYPHEYFGESPYDGLLVSRGIVGGSGFSGKYSASQRQRFLREGARKFLRFPRRSYQSDPMLYPIMGDCGAFSYVEQDLPPISNEETIDYYVRCGFTHGVSVDHIVRRNEAKWDDLRRLPTQVESRTRFTHQSAIEFLRLCQQKKVSFVPIGVVQSWSPKSAARFAGKLVDAGYTYIGLGGLVGQKSPVIYDTVAEVRARIPVETKLHVFGFNCMATMEHFIGLNITSFDSTAPILKAFKDDLDNYSMGAKLQYTALRVPPSHENKISRRLQGGAIDYEQLRDLESTALRDLRDYEAGYTDMQTALDSLLAYERFLDPDRSYDDAYRRTLEDRPWEHCDCRACTEIGIEVLIYRGMNRNKRRGFHNLHCFHRRLKAVRDEMRKMEVPCIRSEQSKGRYIYSFVVNGKQIPQFASISRISRDGDGGLLARIIHKNAVSLCTTGCFALR